VSRLVIIVGLPIAVRVLIADAARDGCGDGMDSSCRYGIIVPL
jgi:hypothetical protein